VHEFQESARLRNFGARKQTKYGLQNRPTKLRPPPPGADQGTGTKLIRGGLEYRDAAPAASVREAVGVNSPSRTIAKPPTCPTPSITTSAVLATSPNVPQFVSLLGQPVLYKSIQGPTIGYLKSLAPGASDQNHERNPQAAAYQAPVKPNPSPTVFQRDSGGGNW